MSDNLKLEPAVAPYVLESPGRRSPNWEPAEDKRSRVKGENLALLLPLLSNQFDRIDPFLLVF
jgi:hypothetical protein